MVELFETGMLVTVLIIPIICVLVFVRWMGGGSEVAKPAGIPTVWVAFGGGTVIFGISATVTVPKFGGGTDLLGGGMFLIKSGSVILLLSLGSSPGAGIFNKSIGLGLGISFSLIGEGDGIFCNCNGAGGGIVSVFMGSGCGIVCTGIGFGAGIDVNSTVCIQGGGKDI